MWKFYRIGNVILFFAVGSRTQTPCSHYVSLSKSGILMFKISFQQMMDMQINEKQLQLAVQLK